VTAGEVSVGQTQLRWLLQGATWPELSAGIVIRTSLMSLLVAVPPPDMAMILTAGNCSLSSRMVSIPSFSGMKMSVTITSAGQSRCSARPSAPCAAARTS
jgi:hypothetical protein